MVQVRLLLATWSEMTLNIKNKEHKENDMQLQEVPVMELKELTNDGKVYVLPEYETVARTAEMPEHTVLSGAGDGEKNFHIVCFGKVPKKTSCEKQF